MNAATFSEVKGRGPPTRICYICGRPYGINSYDIHLKQCKDLWIAREELKDPKERKPLPQDPIFNTSNNNKSSSNNKQNNGQNNNLNLDELNRLASESFNTVSLEKCAVCGRTFLPEKLLIHQRACTVDHPARRIDESVRRGVAASLAPSFTKNLPNVSPNNSMNNNNNSLQSSPQQNTRPQTAQAASSGGRSRLTKPSAISRLSSGGNDNGSNYDDINTNSNNSYSSNDCDNGNNDNDRNASNNYSPNNNRNSKNNNNNNNNNSSLPNVATGNNKAIDYANSNLTATLSAIQLDEDSNSVNNQTNNHHHHNNNNSNNNTNNITLIQNLEKKVLASEMKVKECMESIDTLSKEVIELKSIMNKLLMNPNK